VRDYRKGTAECEAERILGDYRKGTAECEAERKGNVNRNGRVRGK
jgi:hypothetical protein